MSNKTHSNYLGRISDEVFDNTHSLLDLIEKMSKDEEGRTLREIGSVDSFSSRYEKFKEFLYEEYPEFTDKEILKFDKNFYRFARIYKWKGADKLLQAFEYNVREKEVQLNKEVQDFKDNGTPLYVATNDLYDGSKIDVSNRSHVSLYAIFMSMLIQNLKSGEFVRFAYVTPKGGDRKEFLPLHEEDVGKDITDFKYVIRIA